MARSKEVGAREKAPILDRIPAAKRERNRLVAIVREYVAAKKPVPPLSLDELFHHTNVIIERNGLEPVYRDYLTVLVGNEVWREQVAGLPYDRRLLLLPKCRNAYGRKKPAQALLMISVSCANGAGPVPSVTWWKRRRSSATSCSLLRAHPWSCRSLRPGRWIPSSA